MKIKKNDKVTVIAGSDKGKSGKVILALPKTEQVIVEGVNVKKRHVRTRTQGKKGEVVEAARPIHVSNVKIAK